MKPIIKGLYAITPDMADTALLLERTTAALRGGARVVQYRSKSRDIALRHEQATELTRLCHEFHAPLIVNDDVRLAVLSGADGVHLGKDDPNLTEARINLGPDKLIGVSCYDELARAQMLSAAGADYVAFGSFFPSSTKPHAPPCPIEVLIQAKEKFAVPSVAIGGITLANAGPLVAAGADAVAVISALYDAPDIELAAVQFSALFATRH